MADVTILDDWTWWKSVMLRDGLQCVYCGLDGKTDLNAFRQLTTQIDHLVPQTLGGTNDEDNLATCCRCCNQWKGSFDPRDELPGSVERDPHTPRDRMIARVRAHLRTKDWDYYEKCQTAFLALLGKS